MNIYRVSIQSRTEPEQAVCIEHYDVDAMLPSIAIRRAMKVAQVTDEMSVVCRLYASDILSTSEKKVRRVLGEAA